MKFYYLIHSEVEKISKQVVSVIGGGGKSTLLQKIAKELVEENLKVILTSTTKFQLFPGVELTLKKEHTNYFSRLKDILVKNKVALLANDFYKSERLVGVEKESVPELTEIADIILIEADGSRQRSLKTHKKHEPVIPEISTTVIIICGANVVGQPLSEETVHRAKLFSEKWNLPFGAVLTPEIIARELLSARSYLRYIPNQAVVSIFINKADNNLEGGKILGQRLIQKCKFPIFIGSVLENYIERF